MFFGDKKLSSNLKDKISDKKLYDTRVIIYCDKLLNVVEKKILSTKGQVVNINEILGCITAYARSKTIDRLIELPMVKYISLDDEAHLIGQWNSSTTSSNPYVSLPDVESSISVAIIDSGVYPHNDLTRPNNKIAGFIDLVNNYEKPYDDNGHGTFISGIICGNGGKTVKYKGLIPKANIFMIKAFNSFGKAYASDILQGISLVIDNSSEYNIKVLSLPFEFNFHDSRLKQLFKKAFKLCSAKKISVITSINSSINKQDTLSGLASLDHCISVGGRDPFKEITYHKLNTVFNAKENKPEFIAPCNRLVSLNHDKEYLPSSNDNFKNTKLKKSYISLTSLSCACGYISGIFAFIYSCHPDFNPEDIKSFLSLCSTVVIEDDIFKSRYIDINLLLENINNYDKISKKLISKKTEGEY